MTLKEIEDAMRAESSGTIPYLDEWADALAAERERIDRWANEIDAALRRYESGDRAINQALNEGDGSYRP